ncbi:hypothetical protein V492_05700 [Pseudogymnoascus sp. VKM F-4246]|nr:hypothetical protein V492_05700 [Pseudogymnoascus sp. VKM F-4246]
MAVMRSLLPVVALLAVCAKAATDETDWKKVKPNEQYINDMCQPRYEAIDPNKSYTELAVLSDSPFPCEQEYFLRRLCFSNGTTPNDFLAEQQCLCNGNYFETILGCYNCRIAHGVIASPSQRAFVTSDLDRLRKAECTPTPVTQPYTNMLIDFNSTSYMLRSDLTLSSHKSGDTAVSNYYTGASVPIAGEITGAAVDHLSSFTNYNYDKFTPTGAASTGGTAATKSAPTTTGGADAANSTGGADAASSTGGADAATSTGGAAEVRVAGGLLAAVIGVLAAL